MSDQILYIIMRTDLASMNPGKGMAQSSHAYGALKKYIKDNPGTRQAFLSWMSQTPQEFGTTIVLGGTLAEIHEALAKLWWLNVPVAAGWVHDDTYPIRDGDVTHLIPLDTCAFILGTKTDCAGVLGKLELHE